MGSLCHYHWIKNEVKCHLYAIIVPILLLLITGIYILASQKNSPPPLKFFPVFVDFLQSFKLHKGILTCVLLLFFSSFHPFSLPFFKFSFKFFPVFQFGQNIYPCLIMLKVESKFSTLMTQYFYIIYLYK